MRVIRMARVTQKGSGCFRTGACAHAHCRRSSTFQILAALGNNPLIAITIALQGRVVACLDHDVPIKV